jgi:hypothetical protein
VGSENAAGGRRKRMVCPYNKCARAGGHSPACWPKTFSRLQLRRCASSHSANPFMLQPENNRLRVFARCRIPELVAREPPLFFFPIPRTNLLRLSLTNEADVSPFDARSVGESTPRLFACQARSCVRSKKSAKFFLSSCFASTSDPLIVGQIAIGVVIYYGRRILKSRSLVSVTPATVVLVIRIR